MIQIKHLGHQLAVKDLHHGSLLAKEVHGQIQKLKAQCPGGLMHLKRVSNGGGERRSPILHPKIDGAVNSIDTITAIPVIECLDVAEVDSINLRILGLK